jgi:hypothetical protein
VTDLEVYIEGIVEPTFADFNRHRTSRHAFLTCVAIYHAIDRASEMAGISVGNLRKTWSETMEFKLIDIVAHHFKHVQNNDEKISLLKPGIPIGFMLGFNAEGTEMELRNFYFIMRDAIKFLHVRAKELAES